MSSVRRAFRLVITLASLVCGCKSKPPPPSPDDARECREGKAEACASACIHVDPSFCEDAIIARRSEAGRDEGLYWSLLERACQAGALERCEELGGLTLGRDEQRALAAYERACAGRDAGGPDCLETRKAWIDTAGAARRRCEAGDSGACVNLGDTYRAAQSPDDAIEAFGKACEIRGLDTEAEGVYLERPWGECSNDARIPHHPHPGPRGRCGTFAIFNTSPGHARHEINEPPREGPGPAPPRQPTRRAPAKMQIGEPGHTKGDYPTEKLAAELEAMRERFAQCAGESPELEGRYSFIGTFVLDRAGVPAFFQLQHQPNDVGQVSGEPWRRLRACFELIVSSSFALSPHRATGLVQA